MQFFAGDGGAAILFLALIPFFLSSIASSQTYEVLI